MSEALKQALRSPIPGDDHVDDVTMAAYLDGTLEAPDRDRAEAHLGRCPVCSEDLAAAARVEIEAEAVERVDRPRPVRAEPAPRARSRATSTRTWLRLAAGIALVFGALLASREVGRFVAGRLEPVLIAQLEEWTDRGVSTEGTSLTVAGGPGIELTGLAIADDPRFSNTSFAGARRVALQVHPAALLGGKLQGSIDIEGPVVRLVRNRVGQWNIETLGGAAPSAAHRAGVVSEAIERALDDAARGIPPSGVSRDPRVQLTSATIEDGTLEIQDLGRAGDALRVKNVDLSYHGVPGQRASVSLEGHVGAAQDRIALRGEIGPFEGDVVPVYRLREVELESVPVAEIPGAPRAVVGQLTFDGHLQSAGRALVDVVAAARGAGELELCCGAFQGRNVARDFIGQLSHLPGGDTLAAAARSQAALRSALDAQGTTYDRLAGIADLEPGTLHVAGLEIDTALFRADADASIGLEGRIAADGTILLAPQLGSVLIAAAPILSTLADESGALELPFQADGPWENLDVQLDLREVVALLERTDPTDVLAWFRARLFADRLG